MQLVSLRNPVLPSYLQRPGCPWPTRYTKSGLSPTVLVPRHGDGVSSIFLVTFYSEFYSCSMPDPFEVGRNSQRSKRQKPTSNLGGRGHLLGSRGKEVFPRAWKATRTSSAALPAAPLWSMTPHSLSSALPPAMLHAASQLLQEGGVVSFAGAKFTNPQGEL